MINKNTKKFCSLAINPGNTGSKFYNKYFKKKKIDAIYLPLKLKSNFKETVRILRQIGFLGCSISMPFKNQAWQFVSKKPSYLRRVKSVNTIIFAKNKSEGFSTDFYSAKKIIENNKINKYKSVIIVGTGSMAKIFNEILEASNKKISFISRKPIKKNQLNINRVKNKKFEILINASPLGMNNFPKFPIKNFNFINCKFILDLVSDPSKTDLCNFAQKNKINFIGGITFAKIQAEKQLKIYKKFL